MRKPDGITPRDFMNGILLAAGGAAVAGSSPMRAFVHHNVGEELPLITETRLEDQGTDWVSRSAAQLAKTTGTSAFRFPSASPANS